MATPAEIQEQLDTGGNMMRARIIKSIIVDGTYDAHYVQGLVDFAGRARWVTTTAADSAATQATASANGLKA